MASAAGKVVGWGLAIAAITIIALSIAVMVELERESRLQREVIAQIEATDQLEALRNSLARLGPAARIAALTGAPESLLTVEAMAGEIERALATLAERPRQDGRHGPIEPVASTARVAIANARSIAETRERLGSGAADVAAREAEARATEAATALDRVIDVGAARINRQALAQLRAGETMRRYVALTLGGSILMLWLLYELYRRARRRERAALARIEHMAHYDAITGLPNRSLLADRLEQEVSRAHRNERAFALISFDLDGFKAVNDTWGHDAGDAALRVVAQRSREAVRASDTLGRQGGDEFLALLPETSLEGALHVAEKLRTALSQPYAIGTAQARMSASLGVALFPAHGSDAQALQRAADAALYEAKREGKNRVKVASRAAATPAAQVAGVER